MHKKISTKSNSTPNGKNKNDINSKESIQLPTRSPSRTLIPPSIGLPISPSKRGILSPVKLDTESTVISPAKTPTGRAGLPSPKRRSVAQLNQSARKRAIRTSKKYARLMEEDLDNDSDADDYLASKDRILADMIIKESRNDDNTDDFFPLYGSDVEFEEDLTQTGNRRTQEPRNKNDKSPPQELNDSDSDSTPYEEISDDEYNGSPRSKKRKYTNDLHHRHVRPKSKDEDDLKETSPKRKIGRPRKTEKVIGKVKSIFQMDDEILFKENKQEKPQAKNEVADSSISKDSDTLFTVDFDSFTERTNLTIPTISGDPRKGENLSKDEVESSGNKFVPFPIPEVDSEGNVSSEFREKYLSSTASKEYEENRLVDERAFFLEGTEGYFEQHMGRPKASTNSLSQLAPSLEYDDFIPLSNLSGLIRSKEKKQLHELQKCLYHQWCFEMTCGYNLIFYGMGSKRKLLLDFVQNYFIDWYEKHYNAPEFPSIMVVNGYNSAVKFKKIILDILSVFLPEDKRRQDKIKFPKLISESVPFLVNYINATRDKNASNISPKLILLINNIDGEVFRDDKIQSLISELCTLPEIWLMSSTDNINVSLLWDLYKLKKFNFLWHDLTTYEPYTTELSFRDILSMGKSKKFIGSKGAKYVLGSLTKNAKNLYKILLMKQVEIMKSSISSKSSLNGLRGSTKLGISMKALYDICLEEFIISNETNFRTLLGEFIEHKMCNLTKDESGVEIIYVPFTFDEVEKLLNEEFIA